MLRHLGCSSLKSDLPWSVLQVSIPLWALVHLPVVVTVTTAIFTPKGWLHCILYVLFENAMGIVKMGAVVAGECCAIIQLCGTQHMMHEGNV